MGGGGGGVADINIFIISTDEDPSLWIGSFAVINLHAVAIRTGTVRRVWFAVRTAVRIFLAIVGEIFVFFDFYNLILINQQ